MIELAEVELPEGYAEPGHLGVPEVACKHGAHEWVVPGLPCKRCRAAV